MEELKVSTGELLARESSSVWKLRNNVGMKGSTGLLL